MKKNSITNKISPCCSLPFSVVYWWVSNLTLNSNADREFIISKISQSGTISIDAWKVLINSGTLENDSPLTKAEFLAWFDCERQPSCEQLKLIIEGFKVGNWTPETELPQNIGLIDVVVNGQNFKGNVYTKEQVNNLLTTSFGGDLVISDNPQPTSAKWYFAKESGTYPNAGGLVVDLTNKLVILSYDGTTWSKIEVEIPMNTAKIATWTATTFASGSQVLYDGKIWESNSSTTATDIPGFSSKWVAKIDGSDANIDNALNSYINEKNYVGKVDISIATAIRGNLQNDNTVIDEDRVNITVLNIPTNGKAKVYLKMKKVINALYNSRTAVLGIAVGGAKTVLMTSQSTVGQTLLREYEFDVSAYEKISICFDGREEFKGWFFESITKKTTEIDVVKKSIDFYKDLLKSFWDQRTNKTANINISTRVIGSMIDYTNTVISDVNRWLLKDIPTEGRTRLYIKFAKSIANDNNKPSIVGVLPNGSSVPLLDSFGAYPPPLTEYIIDVKKFEKVSIVGYNIFLDFEAYFYDEAIASTPDAVKTYIDNSVSILQDRKIHLYNLGFRTTNTSEQNSAIFNLALSKMDSVPKDIIIPEGKFKVDSIIYKNRANIYGQGQNTVLESTKAEPIFKLSVTDGKNRIEYNNLLLLGTTAYANQGGCIKDLILSGNSIGTKGFEFNAIAYFRFQRVYMTAFTDVCFEGNGMMLCNFEDVQFTKSPNGLRVNMLSPYWANLNTFTDCKFRYLTNIGIDYSNGTGVNFIGCDISAVGTTGDLNTGAFKMSGGSTEAGFVRGCNLSMLNCWGEANTGGFLIKLSNPNGRSRIAACNFLYNDTGIVTAEPLTIDTSTIKKTESLSGGKIIVINSQITTHTETGGTYTVLA